METRPRHRTGRTTRTTTQIPIAGLTCAGESAALERSLETLPGIVRVVVNPIVDIAYVWYDPDRCTIHAMRAMIERSGYRTL